MWSSIINAIGNGNAVLNDIVWGWPAIVLILGTGLLLSIRSKFLQLRKFGDSFSSTIGKTIKGMSGKKEKNKDSKGVSQFEAFAAAISGTVGTGNIIGVTSAIITGGPGAVFWMWVSAFFGMVTNYSENLLGLYYRKRNKNGEFSGGAFYYIANGMKWKWLGYVAAAFCLFAAIGMSGVQTNKISGTVADSLNMAFNFNNMTTVKLVIGIIVAIVTALVIIGGIKRIGRVASILVPFMSVLFITLALIIILMHVTAVPAAFAMIFKYAFGYRAAAGGIFGYAFSQVIRKGMARGVFSNEAGLGSSVIAHSASETREPVKQGLWGIFEVFFDTFIICTLAALMILTAYSDGNGGLTLTAEVVDSSAVLSAFMNNLGVFGVVAFSIILPLFAFTTILAWSYYGEKATEFFFQWLGEKGQAIAVLVFKIIYVLLIVASAVIESDLAWALSDTANGLMAIPNLICLVVLSGQVVKVTKNYYDRKKGIDVEPMLSAYPEQNEEFKEYIKAHQEG